jgi:hypothetical protein
MARSRGQDPPHGFTVWNRVIFGFENQLSMIYISDPIKWLALEPRYISIDPVGNSYLLAIYLGYTYSIYFPNLCII